MFFETHASLDCNPTEAVIKFCQIIDPSSKAFHPTYTLQDIAQKSLSMAKGILPPSFCSARSALKVLDESYRKALKRHLEENPLGPVPKKITCQIFSQSSGYRLKWVTSGGTWINVFITATRKARVKRMQTEQPILSVSGHCAHSVRKYAIFAGLPLKLVVPKVVTSPEIPVIGLSDMARYAEVPRFRNIRVPLGEFLDLLQKYDG